MVMKFIIEFILPLALGIFLGMMMFPNKSKGEELTPQFTCLALNMYHEARSDKDLFSYIAVSNVVMNRVKSPKYPNNICDVVKQKHQSLGS